MSQKNVAGILERRRGAEIWQKKEEKGEGGAAAD